MKKTLRTIKTALLIIVVILCVNLISGKIEIDYFKNYQQIYINNILTHNNESIYVYFYKVGCPYCKEVQNEVETYARSHSSFYFVNTDNQKDMFKKFDWIRFHTDNDIEIGKMNDQQEIEFYTNESQEKYMESQEKDIYGKVKKYEIIEADDDYIKLNQNARKGYVYASLQTPDINYYDMTSSDEMIIAGVPTLLYIENGKITEFYFDSVEIETLLIELNK